VPERPAEQPDGVWERGGNGSRQSATAQGRDGRHRQQGGPVQEDRLHMPPCLTTITDLKARILTAITSTDRDILFSNGFRDYDFWTIVHRKGVSGNESYETLDQLNVFNLISLFAQDVLSCIDTKRQLKYTEGFPPARRSRAKLEFQMVFRGAIYEVQELRDLSSALKQRLDRNLNVAKKDSVNGSN
ncbi:hypothetical protein AVEN_212910-1, partial [Araneus ventricosus]